MSKDPEINRIIEENKRKYLVTPSKHYFYGGIIILISLAIGLFYFQFDPISESPEITPEDIDLLRRQFGVLLGLGIALISLVIYGIWISWRGYKFKKEATAEALAYVLKNREKNN